MVFIVRKRTATEIFKETWLSFFALLVPLTVAGVVSILPIQLLEIFLSRFIEWPSGEAYVVYSPFIQLNMIFSFLSTVLLFLSFCWYQVFSIQLAGERYLKKGRSVREMVVRSFRLMLPVLLFYVVLGIAAYLGMMLFVLPGILILLAFYLVLPVYILEEQSILKACRRSAFLVKGAVWRTVFVWIANVVSVFVLLFALVQVSKLGWKLPMGGQVVATIVNLIFFCIFYPFWGLSSLQVYLSRRAELEALDVDLIVDDFDQSDEDNEASVGVIPAECEE